MENTVDLEVINQYVAGQALLGRYDIMETFKDADLKSEHIKLQSFITIVDDDNKRKYTSSISEWFDNGIDGLRVYTNAEAEAMMEHVD
jgi:hypothetical protein